MLVYVAVRLTEAQVRALDEYRQKHALARSAAARDLLQQQLRYQAWIDGRRQRNLPPFPSSRLPRIEVSKETFANVARATDALRDALHGLREKAKKLVRRVARDHENEQLEREMNADLERRAKVHEDPPEARK